MSPKTNHTRIVSAAILATIVVSLIAGCSTTPTTNMPNTPTSTPIPATPTATIAPTSTPMPTTFTVQESEEPVEVEEEGIENKIKTDILMPELARVFGGRSWDDSTLDSVEGMREVLNRIMANTDLSSLSAEIQDELDGGAEYGEVIASRQDEALRLMMEA